MVPLIYFLQEATVTIDNLCNVMTNQSIGDELDRYAAVNIMFLKMQGSESLDVSYQGYVEFMKNTSLNSSAAGGGKHGAGEYNIYLCIQTDICYYCSSPVVLPDLYGVWILPDYR